MTPAVLDVDVPFEITSLNAVKGRHWKSRHAYRSVALLALASAGVSKRKRLHHPTPDTRQAVRITRYYAGRERPFDDENLAAGSAKALVDVLTSLRFWKDDSPRYLHRTYTQERVDARADPRWKRGARCHVQIVDLQEAT